MSSPIKNSLRQERTLDDQMTATSDRRRLSRKPCKHWDTSIPEHPEGTDWITQLHSFNGEHRFRDAFSANLAR
jgi:hypothetical protein